jgi:hypothetical protein
VPTITAVGVANPKAHGHAIHNTVMAVRKANSRIISVLLVDEGYKEEKYTLQKHQEKIMVVEMYYNFLHITLKMSRKYYKLKL